MTTSSRPSSVLNPSGPLCAGLHLLAARPPPCSVALSCAACLAAAAAGAERLEAGRARLYLLVRPLCPLCLPLERAKYATAPPTASSPAATTTVFRARCGRLGRLEEAPAAAAASGPTSAGGCSLNSSPQASQKPGWRLDAFSSSRQAGWMPPGQQQGATSGPPGFRHTRHTSGSWVAVAGRRR